VQVVEALLGDPWQGEGLAGAGQVLVRDTLWNGVLARLEAGLKRLRAR